MGTPRARSLRYRSRLGLGRALFTPSASSALGGDSSRRTRISRSSKVRLPVTCTLRENPLWDRAERSSPSREAQGAMCSSVTSAATTLLPDFRPVM